MSNAATLVFGNTTTPTSKRLPDPLPVTDYDPILGSEGCGWCGRAFTIYQVYTAVLQGGTENAPHGGERHLWGYVHESCMAALRARIRR